MTLILLRFWLRLPPRSLAGFAQNLSKSQDKAPSGWAKGALKLVRRSIRSRFSMIFPTQAFSGFWAIGHYPAFHTIKLTDAARRICR